MLEGRSVDSKSEIPRPGRSPDSVPRVFAFPVSQWHKENAPHYSDCIVPDFHRVPFSPPVGGTCALLSYSIQTP